MSLWDDIRDEEDSLEIDNEETIGNLSSDDEKEVAEALAFEEEYKTSQKEFFIPMLEKARSKDYRVYNGVFKEMYQNCPQLLIPLVNKMFGTNYDLSTPVKRLDKDQPYSGRGVDDKNYMSEKYPDSLFEIEGQYYHIECEVDRDDDIFIRIIHYNLLISYNNRENFKVEKTENNAKITVTDMPQIHSGVFYIKNHENIGETNLVNVGGFSGNIPCFIVPRNNLDGLIRDNLFLAFPFYMVRYESQLKDKEGIADIDSIRKDDEKFCEGLRAAVKKGILTQRDVDKIRQCTQTVIDHLVADDFDKEVAKAMFKELVDEEKNQGIEIGEDRKAIEMIKSLMQTTKESFEQVCKMLNVKSEDIIRYKKMI